MEAICQTFSKSAYGISYVKPLVSLGSGLCLYHGNKKFQ